MFIAIDIGNTSTNIGIYEKENLVAQWCLTSLVKPSCRKLGIQIQQSLKLKLAGSKDIEGIGISSVVTDLTDIYSETCKKYLKKQPQIIKADLELGIKINYKNPVTLGSDRICSAIAGFKKYGGPLIIIDFGTATTFNVIASNGDYLGGMIMPGVDTSAISLHQRTSKLPQITLEFPNKVICTDTKSAMQAGILFGTIDATRGLVERIQKELQEIENKKAKIIATGGFAKLIVKQMDMIDIIDESLVLDGIMLICTRLNNKR